MKASLDLSPIAMDSIEVDQGNVRKIILDESIDELAQSIKEIGLQQPIVVFRKGEKHSLIVGQRRYLACKKLGWSTIPAIITNVKTQTQTAIISFSENIHRTELDYRDKMRAAMELLRQLETVKKVAQRLGLSEGTIRNYIGYEAVPNKLKDMVKNREIGAITALRIARNIPDQRRAIEIASKVMEEPTRRDRKLIVDFAKENPGKSASQVVDLVKERKPLLVKIHLAPGLVEALNDACREYQGDREDILTQALSEWLERRGFLK